jgi:hypothetical protein
MYVLTISIKNVKKRSKSYLIYINTAVTSKAFLPYIHKLSVSFTLQNVKV